MILFRPVSPLIAAKRLAALAILLVGGAVFAAQRPAVSVSLKSLASSQPKISSQTAPASTPRIHQGRR